MIKLKVFIISFISALKQIFTTWRVAILAVYLLLLGYAWWRFADKHLFNNMSLKNIFDYDFMLSASHHLIAILSALGVLLILLMIFGIPKFKIRFHNAFVEHDIKTKAGNSPVLLANTKDKNSAMDLIFYTRGLPLFSSAEQIDNIGRILDISIKVKPKIVYGSNQLVAVKAVDGFAEANRGDIIE